MAPLPSTRLSGGRKSAARISGFGEAGSSGAVVLQNNAVWIGIHSVIDQVKVDDAEIRVVGRRTVLERLMTGGGAAPAGVLSFVRKWCAR